jgi:hypothetical protein
MLMMNRRYKIGTAREQISLLPPRIEDYVSPDALVRAIDVYVDTLDFFRLGFRYADGGLQKAMASRLMILVTISSFIFTAISTRCAVRAVWSAKRSAILRSSGCWVV